MNENEFKQLLNKHLAGNASGEEWNKLAALIREGSYDDIIQHHMDAAWENEEVLLDAPYEKYHDIAANILQTEAQISRMLPAHKPLLRRSLTWMSAACVVLLLTAAGLYLLQKQTAPAVPVTASAPEMVVADTTIIDVQTKFTRLPDGSTVLLADNSHLRYQGNLTGNTREVILEGEAYFDIKEQPGRPFIVKTGKVSTVVLGTAFNVKAWPAEDKVVVTVTRGKVKVEESQRSYGILTADQQLTVNTISKVAFRAQVESETETAWKNQYLVLDDITMEQAALLIGIKYHVKIVFANEKLKQCRIAGTFSGNQSLEKVLNIVCAVINASYTMHPNDQVIIAGEGCQ